MIPVKIQSQLSFYYSKTTPCAPLCCLHIMRAVLEGLWAIDCKERSVDAETVGGRVVRCLVSSDGASPGTTFWVGSEAEVW